MPDAASGEEGLYLMHLRYNLMFSDANQKIYRRFQAGGLSSYWNDVLSP